jgi:hypothetical protein
VTTKRWLAFAPTSRVIGPDDDCDDGVRKSRHYFQATGELAQ